MNAYVQRRDQLALMSQALAATVRQIEQIGRQIRTAAEAQARAASGRARQFGRHSTTWGPPDERCYQQLVASVTQQRQPEIGALERRRDRQAQALASYRRKYGFNEPIAYKGDDYAEHP